MTTRQPKTLFIQTFYPEFLSGLYADDATLHNLPFDEQRQRLLATAFGAGDAYSNGLRALECEATDVICNADLLQARWAAEHGVQLAGNIHDRRRQVVAAQIAAYRPEVLYVFEWSPLGDTFLAEMKPQVRLLVGQIASPLPASRTFAAYDLMISSWPPLVEHFRSEGLAAESLRLGFDARVLNRLEPQDPEYNVTFVGGFAPSHTDRIKWLERLLAEVEIEVFGYGVENTPARSPIREHHRGEVWGWKMYQTLQRSRITLNRHAGIDIRGKVDTRFANNMRLYEATGAGTCLISEDRDNLADLFEVGREVVVYRDENDCVAKIRHYLHHENERIRIAQSGQQRTLRDHTYTDRMGELREILTGRL